MNRRHLIAASLATLMAPPAFGQFNGASGIREMLISAARLATERLGRTNGFFGDSIVRIPLPGLLGSTQRRLQPLGLSGPLDDVELRMNRAAESVMPATRDLVVGAVRNLTINDAVGIVRGGDTAATGYLRQQTEAPLTGLLRPPMQDTLSQSGAYAAVDQAASLVGNNGGTLGRLFGRGRGRNVVTDYRGEITDFAVARALDGVFHYIGEEERSFRSNPLDQSRGLLEGLFGRR